MDVNFAQEQLVNTEEDEMRTGMRDQLTIEGRAFTVVNRYSEKFGSGSIRSVLLKLSEEEFVVLRKAMTQQAVAIRWFPEQGTEHCSWGGNMLWSKSGDGPDATFFQIVRFVDERASQDRDEGFVLESDLAPSKRMLYRLEARLEATIEKLVARGLFTTEEAHTLLTAEPHQLLTTDRADRIKWNFDRIPNAGDLFQREMQEDADAESDCVEVAVELRREPQ